MASVTSKISPCLWFDNEAEDVANFYTSVFENSSIKETTYFTVPTPSNKPVGSVLTVVFELEGLEFTALNGGPEFKFNEAVSFQVFCETQEEVDYYWEKLSSVPESEACGWCKDKFGVSWQIVPTVLADLLRDSDGEKAKRTMAALLDMKKLDIAALQSAHDGE